MPIVPVSVWEQISVVVVFAFLMAGLAWLMVKAFSNAVADINSHYAEIIKASNLQWQQYFDARSETGKLINTQIVEQLKSLTNAITELSERHDLHDTMVRNALDAMADKRKPLAKK